MPGNNPDRSSSSDEYAVDEDDGSERVSRRDYLRVGAAAAGAAVTPFAFSERASAATPDRLADPSPDSSEVGGGAAYYDSLSSSRKVTESDADTVITDGSETTTFVNALNRTNETIFIRGDVEMNLETAWNESSQSTYIPIAEGVTIASDRGAGSTPSKGALLYFPSYLGNDNSVFRTWSGGIRVTGIRFEGPDPTFFEPSDEDSKLSEGFWFKVKQDDADATSLGKVEVDNCQMYGWTHTPVSVGAKSYKGSADIHHNCFHNNQMKGYGYGPNIYNGESKIYYSWFAKNRHSIVGFGRRDNSFEAHHNIVESSVSHAFDMHGLDQNVSGEDGVAGKTIDIHDNQFRFVHSSEYTYNDGSPMDQEAIAIRGNPDDMAYITNNQFKHDTRPQPTGGDHLSGEAYRQRDVDGDGDWTRFSPSGNEFGVTNFSDDFSGGGGSGGSGGTVTTARETGYVTIDNTNNDSWFTESLNHSFSNPVAFLKAFTHNDGAPAHGRIKNVQSTSFDMMLEEWDYQDGDHGTETGHFFVVDEGVHVTSNDIPYECGTVTTDENWATVSFDQNFDQTPVVFTQTQTYNGPNPVVTRNQNVSTGSFEVRVQEEDNPTAEGHKDEEIGYFAIEPGVADFGDATVEFGTTTADDAWKTINFSQSHDTTQRFLADMQTYDGVNACHLRRRNLSASSVDIHIEEEGSEDSERSHNVEEIGYMVTNTSASF